MITAFAGSDSSHVEQRFPPLPRSTRLRSVPSLVLAWLLYICVIWALAHSAAPHIEPLMTDAERGTVAALSAWDGVNYRDIAVDGYTREGVDARNVAFFPLLPLLARVLGGTEHAALAGILLSQLLLLGSVLMLAMWAPAEEAGLPSQPGFWLMVQPLGFFFAVLYAEALFVFLAIAGYLAFRRGRWIQSASAMFLAGLTRPSAVVLAVLFAPEALRGGAGRHRWRAMLCAAAPLAGIALYVGALGLWLGEPLAYFRIQREAWAHAWALPFGPLLDVLSSGRGALDREADLELMVGYAAAAIALIAVGLRRLEIPLLAYLIAGTLFVQAQYPFTSSPRYILALFPLFIVLARTRVARGVPGVVLATAMFVLQAGFLLRFMGWRWVS